MKGDEFVAALISFIILFAMAAIIVGVLVYTNGLHALSWGGSLDVVLVGTHLPIKYENMLLSYLEVTDDTNNIPMKKIISYAAYQGTLTPNVDGVLVNNFKSDTAVIMSTWVSDRDYIVTLEINGAETMIAGNLGGTMISSAQKLVLRKATAPIIYPKGVTTLSLYIAD